MDRILENLAALDIDTTPEVVADYFAAKGIDVGSVNDEQILELAEALKSAQSTALAPVKPKGRGKKNTLAKSEQQASGIKPGSVPVQQVTPPPAPSGEFGRMGEQIQMVKQVIAEGVDRVTTEEAVKAFEPIKNMPATFMGKLNILMEEAEGTDPASFREAAESIVTALGIGCGN